MLLKDNQYIKYKEEYKNKNSINNKYLFLNKKNIVLLFYNKDQQEKYLGIFYLKQHSEYQFILIQFVYFISLYSDKITVNQNDQIKLQKVIKIFEKQKQNQDFIDAKSQMIQYQKQKSVQDQVDHEILVQECNNKHLDDVYKRQKLQQSQYQKDQQKRQGIQQQMYQERRMKMTGSYARQNVITNNFREIQKRQRQNARELDNIIRQKEQHELQKYNQMKLVESMRLTQRVNDIDQKTEDMKNKVMSNEIKFGNKTMQNINTKWNKSQNNKEQYQLEKSMRISAKSEDHRIRSQQLKEQNEAYDKQIAQLKFKYDIFY